MTSSTPTLAPAAALKSPLEGKLSAARVMRAAIGEMLAGPEAAGLSTLAAGALVVLVRHAAGREGLELNGSTTPVKEAKAVLAMKGLSAQDAELVLSALQMTGFARMRGEALSLPLLDEAIRAESSALRNRMAGWIKRGAGAAPAKSTPRATPAPAPAPSPADARATPEATAEAAAAVPTESAAPLAVEPVVQSPEPRKSQRRIEGGVEYCRFTSSDKNFTSIADDPVVVRIPCKGDSVAEITADYIADLQATFRGVEVDDELRKCRLWCESNVKLRKTFSGFRRFLNSWLTNAMRDSQVRSAVTRNANARNGFGQGGAYASLETVESTPASTLAADNAGPAQGSLMDEFSDLLAEPAAPASAPAPASEKAKAAEGVTHDVRSSPVAVERAAPVSMEPMPREVTKTVSKAVLAARARLQHGAAAAGR